MKEEAVWGPGGRRFYVTSHARERWAERCPAADLTTIEHAIRYSRVAAHEVKGQQHVILLAYGFDRVFVLAKRTERLDPPDTFAAATVFAVPYTVKLFGLTWIGNPLYRQVAFDDVGDEGKAQRSDQMAYLHWYLGSVNPRAYEEYKTIRRARLKARKQAKAAGAALN